MARIARPLTALEVERLDTPGLHAVGAVPGLCLRIPPPPSTAKSWALRLLVNGKRRERDPEDRAPGSRRHRHRPGAERVGAHLADNDGDRPRVREQIKLLQVWADKRAEREWLNPARWRGHLDTQLPRPSKVARPKRPLSDGADLTCPLSPCPRSCVRDPRREFGPKKYAQWNCAGAAPPYRRVLAASVQSGSSLSKGLPDNRRPTTLFQ